jgi:hypothetical protein
VSNNWIGKSGRPPPTFLRWRSKQLGASSFLHARKKPRRLPYEALFRHFSDQPFQASLVPETRVVIIAECVPSFHHSKRVHTSQIRHRSAPALVATGFM